jgi:hypothetical protein
MKSKLVGRRVVVSLERGDRVVASLKEVAHNHELTSASISGIGGINDVTVAYYNLYEKRYIEQNFLKRMNYCPALGMWP